MFLGPMDPRWKLQRGDRQVQGQQLLSQALVNSQRDNVLTAQNRAFMFMLSKHLVKKEQVGRKQIGLC